MYNTIYLITIFILSTILFSYGVTDTADTCVKIDSTIVITVDLNGDEKDDSIFCHITGESWKKPFTVNYKIISNETTILSETSSDEFIDRDFGDTNAMDWCNGYVPCKKEWYLKKLPEEVTKVFKIGNKKREKLLDSTSGISVYSTVQNFYRDSLGYSKKKAKAEARKLVEWLKKMDIVFIVIPGNPIYRSFPRLYDPLKKRFIHFYGY